MAYKWNEGGRWVSHGYYRPGYFFEGKEKALAIAAERGDVKKIDQLVKQGANVNAIGRSKNGKDETTVLQWAVVSWATGAKNAKGIERLLQLGANPNIITNDGSSVMYYVGAGENVIPILELVLKYGGNPNIRDPVERNILSNNTTVLIRAAQFGRLENIKLLLKYGADIDLADGFELTPLLWAADNRFYDVAYYLLEKGANYKKYGLCPGTINGRLDLPEIIKESLQGGLSDAEKPWREKVIKWLEVRGVVIPPVTSYGFQKYK